MTKPKERKKVIWKPGAPEEWGLQAAWVSEKEEKKRKKAYKIPHKFGIDLSPELEKQYRWAVNSFHLNYTYLKKFPSVPEKRILFENLEHSAEAFIRALEDIRNSQIKRCLPMPFEQKTDPVIDGLIEGAKTFEMAARVVCLELAPKAKPGPKTDPFLAEIVKRLAVIYEQATGKKATPGYFDKYNEISCGEFALFVAGVLDAIDKDIYLIKRPERQDEIVAENSFRQLHDFIKQVLAEK